MDPEVWEVRIHFDGLDNIERTIGRDDVTFMNILALVETRGYNIRDPIYCTNPSQKELVENNAKLYELLTRFESQKILKFTVKRARPSVPKKRLCRGRCCKLSTWFLFDQLC